MTKKPMIKTLATNHRKLLWFIGLYALSVVGYATVSYGSRWMIHWLY